MQIKSLEDDFKIMQRWLEPDKPCLIVLQLTRFRGLVYNSTVKHYCHVTPVMPKYQYCLIQWLPPDPL